MGYNKVTGDLVAELEGIVGPQKVITDRVAMDQ